MEQIVVAIIGGIVAIIVAALSVWNKSKQGAKVLEPEEEPVSTQQLIETLNKTVEAQNKQIDILRGIVDEQRLELAEREKEIEDLRQRVSNLERLTVQQALLIDALEKSKGRIRRESKPIEGGET
jgi:peptidoglycan hydrolase CwlO-like protein